MRFKIFRGFILFWTIFIALGAFAGSILMLIKPDGSLVFLDGLLPYFSVLPFSDILFQDNIFSGIMLFIINGVTNLIAFILILLNRKSGYVALVSYCQVKENASFKDENINENSSNLVIYFSWTGHSKKMLIKLL